MCVTAFEDLPEAVRLRPVDVILADHHFWGGLRESVRVARFCRDFGFGVGMHSNSHYGISLAAMAHLGITDRDDRAGLPGTNPDAPDAFADLSRPRP